MGDFVIANDRRDNNHTSQQIITNILKANKIVLDGSLIINPQLQHGVQVDEPASGVHGVVGSIVGTTDTQILTNKTITDTTNSCRATAIGTSGANVVISSTAPTNGQVLTASSSSTALWQTPSGGGLITYSHTYSGVPFVNGGIGGHTFNIKVERYGQTLKFSIQSVLIGYNAIGAFDIPAFFITAPVYANLGFTAADPTSWYIPIVMYATGVNKNALAYFYQDGVQLAVQFVNVNGTPPGVGAWGPVIFDLFGGLEQLVLTYQLSN